MILRDDLTAATANLHSTAIFNCRIASEEMPPDPRRHHYVPRFYLEGFTDDDGVVAVYDIQEARAFSAPAHKTGVKTDFYEIVHYGGKRDRAKVERHFAERIEGPAHPILEKIRARRTISQDEKRTFALYVLSLLTRVPAGMARVQENLPDVSETILAEVDEILDAGARERPELAELAELRKQQAREIVQHMHENPTPEYLVPSPEQAQSFMYLSIMPWEFIVAPETHKFISSDNPFFYHADLGITRGEFTLPLSSGILLRGSLSAEIVDRSFIEGRPHMTIQSNQRTIRLATRFLYAQDEEPWIPTLVKKRGHLRIARSVR